MPSTLEKLRILGDAAKYDLCASTASPKKQTVGAIGSPTTMGICHSYLPDGRCISLLKVLLTNKCIHDCKYCINSTSNNGCFSRKTVSFSPEELADLTMTFYLRNYIEGLFLSSGIKGDANQQAERMHETIKLLREKHKFGSYIHAKVLPGIGKDELKRISEVADRVSINVELPNSSRLSEVCSTKDYNSDILRPSKWLVDFNKKGLIPSGYTTQYVVGSIDETDEEVLKRVFDFYSKDWKFRRQYYSSYLPINDEIPLPSYFLREVRLYQIDWLHRIYHYNPQELSSILNDDGFIPLRDDPKLLLARQDDIFPLEINEASYNELMRVPGIGERSATRIIELQREKVDIRKPIQLKNVGVVIKRALPFLKVGNMVQTTLDNFM
ncbi:MAG: putative DNA modification/repair radical SAM protein [Candidatus Kariarchaeaceae archaeon]